MNTKVSIIIPTFNRPNDLKEALNSVLIQTFLPFEVIVVDQSENLLTKDLVESFNKTKESGNVNFIWHYQKEKGSAKARNAGFRISKGDIICFTDDDVILEKDYLLEIVNCFEKYPQIGGISGNVVGSSAPTGLKWCLRKLLLKVFLLDAFNGKMTASGFGFPIYEREIFDLTYVELLSGYSMNFRRPFLIADLFDEFFTGYSFREDVDLSYRISRHTLIAMVPLARFRHNVSQSNRTDLKSFRAMKIKNYYYVFNKHKNHSFLGKILFAYSMGGILIVDFIEWLSGFKAIKWEAFTMDLSSVFGLLKGRL